jgi:hypothetical protein
MARYSKDQFLRDLAAYSVGMSVGAKNTAKFLKFAGKSGIRLAGIGASRAAVPAARGLGALVRSNPLAFGALTLYEAERRGLLDPAKESAKDITARALFEAGQYLPDRTPEQMLEDFQGLDVGPAPTARKPTKYNRAVKAGMATVKASQYFGKKGTINNPKKAFVTVNRTASKVNKGKKVSSKGAIGKIARAVRRILK